MGSFYYLIDRNRKNLEDQASFKKKIIPLLKEKGILFEKMKRIFAKKAKGGERIDTITQDGLETTNIAKKGDFIIKNQTEAKEMYIITKEEFHPRYQLFQEKSDEFDEYTAVGKILAIEVNKNLLQELAYDKEFYFMASWGEQMVVKEKDFLACPLDLKSVYRIARKEFFETYQRKF